MQPEPKPSSPKFLSLVLMIVSGVLVTVLAIARWTQVNSVEQLQASDPNAVILVEPQRRITLPSFAEQDAQSLKFPGTRISYQELTAAKIPYIPAEAEQLTETEFKIARQAWQYFKNNWNESTGLVNSADGFPSVTLWDQSTAISAVIAAYQLELINEIEFTAKINQTLDTLANLPLYKNELPNKAYNAKTLIPVNYNNVKKKAAIGWSAIEIGRMALWLKIIANKYPEFKTQAEAVWQSWDTKRLIQDGYLYGTSVFNGEEQYNQEGRLGYENYAAWGLKLWGLNVDQALDYQNKAAFVNLYGVDVPYDLRDAQNSGDNNYVLSEPYFLDGIETGFQALPKAYSDRILAAQEARYQATQQLTAIAEDNLDRNPYFVHNTLYVNDQPWGTITDTGENYNHLRFLSSKAVVGWHVLYNTEYTQRLFNFVQDKLISQNGLYNGYYETFKEPNKALTANNNGIILEALLYKQVGKPLLIWATEDDSQ